MTVKGPLPFQVSRDIPAIVAPLKQGIDRETAKLRKLADINITVHTPAYEKMLLRVANIQQRGGGRAAA